MRVLVFSLVIAFASSSAGAAEVNLSGRWEGHYSCDTQQNHTIVLVIEQQRDGLKGTLEVEGDGSKTSADVVGLTSEAGFFVLNSLETAGISISGTVAADGKAIEGTANNCVSGEFHAGRAGDLPPEAPVEVKAPEPLSAEAEAWVAEIRARIAALGDIGDAIIDEAPSINNDIVFGGPFGVKMAVKQELMAELEMARATIAAQGLFDELASGPDRLENGGLGLVLRVVNRALASDWPEAVQARVRDAGLERAAQILRPKLEAAASLAKDLPATLDGLAQAREAIAPIEEYRAAMEQTFGTIDPEGLLGPLLERLAALEADPDVVLELRAALAEARRSSDPRSDTENLLWRVLGPGPHSSAMATLVEEERELAALAAIDAEDQSPPGSDPLEPSLEDIVYMAHNRARSATSAINAKVQRCQASQFADPIEAVECFTYLTLGEVGGLDARVTRVVKLGCETEVAGRSYRCEFLQDVEISFAAGGPTSPDNLDQIIGQFLPGGYGGSVAQAYFDRQGDAGWLVTWTIE